MKDLANIVAIQSRLYRADGVAMTRLLVQSINQGMVEAFQFKGRGVDEQKGAVTFAYGEVTYDDAVYLIETLAFEDRLITFKVHGPTAVADACFAMLNSVLDALGVPHEPEYGTRNESSAMMTLDFHFLEIFKPVVGKFIEGPMRSALATSSTSVVLAPRSFNVDILYQEQTTEGLEQHWVRAPRKLVIEPRAQTALSDRRYFCNAPLDSDTLLRLVADFEAGIVATREQR